MKQHIVLGAIIIRRILGQKKLKWQVKYLDKSLAELFVDQINQDI